MPNKQRPSNPFNNAQDAILTRKYGIAQYKQNKQRLLVMSGKASTEGSVTTEFLSDIIGKTVNVKLASGLLYSGRLESIDGFMNVALSSATEHYESDNNKLLNKFNNDVFLRGTQVMYISEQKI